MIRTLTHLLTLFAFLTTSLATQAQTSPKPPDVQTPPTVTATYAAGTTLNQHGDGTNFRGSDMPILSAQLADIPSVATGWVTTPSSPPTNPGCSTSGECKFRSLGAWSHINYDDPIRNYGQPGAAHCHQWFGSRTANAYSTYASLRTRANYMSARGQAATTVAGGPYNGTAYWFPCFVKTNPFGNGKNYVPKLSHAIIYYTMNPGAKTKFAQRIPRGLRYVFGVNMDDPNDVAFKAEIAAANAQPGTSSTRYTYAGNGFEGYSCHLTSGGAAINTVTGSNPGSDKTTWLKSGTGVDPWNGTCTTGGFIKATLRAPECYVGTTLWMLGGYNHFRQGINDAAENRAGLVGNSTTCPNGWYRLPTLELTFWFPHKGFSDYGAWRLDSDDHMQAKLTALGTPRTVLNGESFHTDWFGGWDDTVFLDWQTTCAGVMGNGGRDCDSSTVSATRYLVGGTGDAAPDGTRNPQVPVGTAHDTSVASGMFELPANKGKGPTTIAGTGGN